MNTLALPALVEPTSESNLIRYVECNKNLISELLLETGAVLFRNFAPLSSGDLELLANTYGTEMMDHSVRLTHRSLVSGKIHTSTEYNPALKILLHTENSFCSSYPQKMFFYCVTASASGGETPLSDVSAVYDALKPKTRAKFEELGVLYVRNFWPGFGPDWKSSFGVSNQEELNQYCLLNSIDIEWVEPDRPRIRQTWPAVIEHPVTHKKVWFNHATTSNLSSVPTHLQALIKEGFQKDDFPNNSYYGDGSEIEEEVLREINEAYNKFEYCNPWLQGDLLLVDNLRLAHGRNPYTGERRINVAMIDPVFRTRSNVNIRS